MNDEERSNVIRFRPPYPKRECEIYTGLKWVPEFYEVEEGARLADVIPISRGK